MKKVKIFVKKVMIMLQHEEFDRPPAGPTPLGQYGRPEKQCVRRANYLNHAKMHCKLPKTPSRRTTNFLQRRVDDQRFL